MEPMVQQRAEVPPDQATDGGGQATNGGGQSSREGQPGTAAQEDGGTAAQEDGADQAGDLAAEEAEAARVATERLGRPSSGVSRAAQSAWQHFKRSKKGKTALKDMDAEEVNDFRRSWLLRKADSTNKVEEVSQEKLSQQLAVKTGWYTKDQIAVFENKSLDQVEELIGGLPTQPISFRAPEVQSLAQ